MIQCTVSQCPHWACRQYGHSRGGVERCQLLPGGYIPQRKVTSVSSSGSLGFIVCEVL